MGVQGSRRQVYARNVYDDVKVVELLGDGEAFSQHEQPQTKPRKEEQLSYVLPIFPKGKLAAFHKADGLVFCRYCRSH